ncbi:MAG: type II CAAX endopeptidase family protein [Candidatus Sulfotelmatobacter sp.]
MSGPEFIPPAQIPPESPAPQPPQYSNSIFRGPNGIRAGWRALIFLAIVAALFAALFVGLGIIANGGTRVGMSQLTPVGLGISEGAIFVIFTIAALIMANIEKRKYGQYGLPLRAAFRKNFWIGTLIGFAAISGCLLGIFALHGFHLTGLNIHGNIIAEATLAWSATFILVGLAEEFAFRGYLQYTLTTGMGFWPSAFLLSALFGLAHARNPGEDIPGLLSVVLFGLLFCLFLRRTGNLWWAVGFHAGWDWGQTFFYGVPDSGIAPYHNLFNCAFTGPRWLTGGTVGPEASIFTPIALLIVAIIFASVYRENRYHTPNVTPQPAAVSG